MVRFWTRPPRSARVPRRPGRPTDSPAHADGVRPSRAETHHTETPPAHPGETIFNGAAQNSRCMKSSGCPLGRRVCSRTILRCRSCEPEYQGMDDRVSWRTKRWWGDRLTEHVGVKRAGPAGRSRWAAESGPRGDWSVGGASIWWAFWAWSDPERRWAPESEPPFPRLWSPVLPCAPACSSHRLSCPV